MSSLVSSEPLRVLLVSPHAQLREEVGDALQAAGEHRYYWVSQPDLALTRAHGLAPHVVLVDDVLGDTNPAVLIERFVQAVPESAVLLLVTPDALSLAQAAVLAGARAFILKPVRGDDLLSTLRQVLGRRVAAQQPIIREADTGRVIVFCASKGGTGRTTMAINTAVCLRENLREPVVVVDADYAAPAIDVALNLRGQRDIRDLLPKLNQLDTDLISSVLATHTSGVRVLLAPPPDALDHSPTLPQVQQITAWLKRMFPWILVDLGLPLDEAAYAFLDAADRAVMSVLPEMVGMRNTRVMLAQFETRHYPPGKVWPILNREGLLGGVKKPDVAAYLGRDLYFAIPNDQNLATETINRGVPMVIAHRRRPVAQAYRKLAIALAEDRKAETAERASRPSMAVDARIAPSRQAPIPILPETFGVPGASIAPQVAAALPIVSAGAPESSHISLPPSRAATRRLLSGGNSPRGCQLRGLTAPRPRRIVLVVVFLLLLIALLTYVLGRTISGLTVGSGATLSSAFQASLATVSPSDAAPIRSPVSGSLPVSAAATSALPVAIASGMVEWRRACNIRARYRAADVRLCTAGWYRSPGETWSATWAPHAVDRTGRANGPMCTADEPQQIRVRRGLLQRAWRIGGARRVAPELRASLDWSRTTAT